MEEWSTSPAALSPGKEPLVRSDSVCIRALLDVAIQSGIEVSPSLTQSHKYALLAHLTRSNNELVVFYTSFLVFISLLLDFIDDSLLDTVAYTSGL
jgi:hypothetical protein